MNSKLNQIWLACLLLVAFAGHCHADDVAGEVAGVHEQAFRRIDVSPASLKLHGGRAAAQVIVTGVTANGDQIDLTRTAKFSSSETVSIRDGYVQAQKDGRESIPLHVGNLKAKLNVEVEAATDPRPISFRWETLAILTKQGCNSGSCHGKPNGRGALELSLNAFDPKLDERSLVRGSFVRFTEPLVPEASLLLKKPTLTVPHGGGKRLRKESEAYALLRQWIYEGCQLDPKDAPTVVQVQVEPKRREIRLRTGDEESGAKSDFTNSDVTNQSVGKQQLRVIAHFSDGSTRDVTRIATYSVSNEAVASVTQSGLVSGVERGQAAVVVRYLDDIVSAHVTFVRAVPGFNWSPQAENNYVDRLVNLKLKQLQFQPAELCDDATFVRRLSLDVRGLLPTADEASEFLADKSPKKRQTLIDRFLESPEYARYWSLKMADLLRINRSVLAPDRAAAYSDWVFESVRNNMPYDEFVSHLLTSTGATSEVQPANFFRVTSDTKQVTETVAQVFMGSRIMCAQCHNHPYESWTQDNYYQIGSAFHEVDRQVLDADKKKGESERAVKIGLTLGRAMTNPRTGVEQQPWPIDRKRPDEDKRVGFVRWLTSPDNAFFARVCVNRIWAHLLGRGIVEPVDDFRSSNPPVNSELLDALAEDFAKSGFDRKHIVRLILNSRTYQRSSKTGQFNESDDELFSHARVRLLAAEQIQDAITQLCEGEQRLEKLKASVATAESELAREDLDDKARGELTKKLQSAQKLMKTHFMTQQPYPHLTTFLTAFGQPERKTACACERREEVSLDQALQLMNSKLIRDRVKNSRLRFANLSNRELADQLYLTAFSRRPSAQESATLSRHLQSESDREQAVEDIVWALINTNEFLFQH